MPNSDTRLTGFKLIWKNDIPTEEVKNNICDELKFKVIEKEFEYIKVFREIFLSDQIHFKGYEFEENDNFDFFCSRGRLDEIDFFNKFLLSDRFLDTFKPYDENPIRYDQIKSKPDFKHINPFTLDGELARVMYAGNAYGQHKYSPLECKLFALKFCQELMPHEYSKMDFYSYYCNGGWNNWFDDFIIDHTYIIFPLYSRVMWVFAYSDSD